MKIICVPEGHNFAPVAPTDLEIILYGPATNPNQASIGASVWHTIQNHKLQSPARAWDILSIALAVVAADRCVCRGRSPNGWTRQFDLHIAVSDPDFWTAQQKLLVEQLQFLTTDIWNVTFLEGGVLPRSEMQPARLDQDCVVLLSGGLDSLVGAIDLVGVEGRKPYAVSQVSQGDKQKQSSFASMIGGGLTHLQLNHNVRFRNQKKDYSQRARSIIFLAYGVLAATALACYHAGEDVKLYICENGFISINPPLTDMRIGSLSTRTTHPFFIGLFQKLLYAAGLRVTLENPYQFQTKGKMLKDCVDQTFLQKHAHTSTSCGRYVRRHKHCGRCLPCLVRRAAFHASSIPDKTDYVFADLSQDDNARFDDVRSVAMAVAVAKNDGISRWAGPALSSVRLGDVAPYKDVVSHGLAELGAFLKEAGVT